MTKEELERYLFLKGLQTVVDDEPIKRILYPKKSWRNLWGLFA